MSEDVRTNYIRKLVDIAGGTHPYDRDWLIKELGEALESVSQETFQQRELLQNVLEHNVMVTKMLRNLSDELKGGLQ